MRTLNPLNRNNNHHFVSIFLFVIFSLTSIITFSQCVSVNAGNDQTNCGTPTNLLMTYTPVKATTSYTVAPITYTPVSFTTGTTALPTSIDDTYSALIPIGFCFKFYGNTYTQCVVGSNGLITFNTADVNQYCEWVITGSLPSVNLPMNSIMAPYHDIYPSVDPGVGTSEIKYMTYGTAPCRTFVVSWSNVPMFDCTEMIANQQLILYETSNVIEVYIKDKPLCTGWNDGLAILGIQNATGTLFTAATGKNSTQWSATNEGYRFSPAGAEISTVQWLQGATVIGSTAVITVNPTSTTTYTAQITVPTCAAPGTLILTDQMIVTISGGVIPTFSPISSVCQNTTAPVLPLTSSDIPSITGTWSPVVSTATIGTTTYTFTPDAGQCASITTLDVTVTAGSIPTFSPIATGCESDVLALLPLTSLNLISGSWSATLGVPVSGFVSYSFTPTVGQCASSVVVDIPVIPLITPSFSPISSLCLNSTPPVLPLNSTNTPPITGTWSSIINTSAVGISTYTFTPNTGQCSVVATINITVSTLLVPTFSPIPAICLNSTPPVLAISSTNTIAIIGSWSPVVSTSVVGNAIYTFTPLAGQCSDLATLTITTTNEIQPSFPVISSICYNSIAPVLPNSSLNTPPIVGSWSSTINSGVVGTQVYTFTPTIGQCAAIVNMNITVNPLPVLVIQNPVPVCYPSVVDLTLPEVTLGSTGSMTYFITNNATNSLPNPSMISVSGTYYIQSETSFGCTAIAPVVVVVNSQPIANFTPSVNVLNLITSTSTMLNSSVNNATNLWVFPDGSTSTMNSPEHDFDISIVGDQIITLIVTSVDGCIDSTSKTVGIEEQLIVYIPNTFTPDGDKFNQTFAPVFTSGYDATSFSMIIFDRWGKVVFESKDVTDDWNGELNGAGELVPDGMYVWKIEFKLKNKDKHVRYDGHVAVLK